MIIYAVIISLFILLVIIGLFTKKEFCIHFGSAFGLFFIVLAVLVIWACQYRVNSEIRDFNSEKISIESLPSNQLENTGIALKIIELNKWLDKEKYDQNSGMIWCDLFTPDVILTLEHIKIK